MPPRLAVRCACLWGGLLGGALLVGNSAWAQLPQTRLYALFPPGGQVGTTFDLTVTRGDDLEELRQLQFSHPGITATQKTTTNNGKTEPVPNQFTVSVAADVPPSLYEVRCVGLYGMSNPRFFEIGQRAEFAEVEPNNLATQAMPVEIGQTINGRINGATDVDLFKLVGQPGQRVIIDCAAKRIDSRLDSTLELHDAAGRRLATARNTSAKDAVLDYTLPAAGEYIVRLTDFVYAGGEDYFYRLKFRATPFVDFVLPPAGVPGSTAQYTIYGRNLPGGQPTDVVVQGHPLQKATVDITLPGDPTHWSAGLNLDGNSASIDAWPYRWLTPEGPSNAVVMGYATSPVTMETEPNNLPTQVNKVTVPAELAGQFQSKGDVDLYQFDAQAGEVVWIEMQGQRLGYGADPYLTIDQVTVNEKGEETLKRIAAVDDEGNNPLPVIFETIHDDPVAKFVAPAAGQYRLSLRDRYAASRGSPSLLYRLTLRRETPDFRVVIVPDGPTPPNQKTPQTWSVGLRKGDQFPVSVVVLRKDGFEGDVTVAVQGLPPGVTCRDISVGAKPSAGVMVFETAEDAAEWAGTVQVVGTAKITDPTAVAAVAVAQQGLKPATDAIPAAEKALAKPADDLAKATAELTAAQAELATKADDEALKKKVADAEAKVAAAKTVNDQAVAAKAAADQKLAEVQAAITQAQQAKDAATKEVAHAARYGTIAWSGRQNVPGETRLSAQLELSVMNEAAPFQVKTEIHRVVANHGRQILVPVKAIRRHGFDADIPLTFVGQPQNVQIENKPVKKGTDEEVFRIFVPANAPVGTYTMYLVAQAQVSYRRNPQKADRLKAEFDAADKAANEAVEQQKALVAKRDEAVKQTAAMVEGLKQATEAKAAADKVLADAQAAEKAAAEAVTKAGEDATAKAEAEKKLADSQAAVKTATETVATAEQTRVTAETQSKTAEEAKVAAEAAVKVADETIKTTMTAKAAADKLFKDADNVAKAKNINFLPTTTPIVLTIKPAPCTVATAPMNGGNVKKGEKVDVKVTIKRQNDFTGPVTLTLPLPPNVKGLQAAEVTIPADQTEGTLVVEATAEATAGAIANLVVRAVSQFDGEALVDQPVAITVQ